MRQAKVVYKGEIAGIIKQFDNGSFEFAYSERWLVATDKPSISLTLPKSKATFQSDHLFAFFYNLLPEGTNKETICFELGIEPDDYFGLLLNTAQYDTIGAVRIEKMKQ